MISEAELDRLVQAGIITAGQREQILAFHSSTTVATPTGQRPPTIPFFRTLYYLGGFILIFAIVYYVSEAWEALEHFGRIAWTAGGMILLGFAGLKLRVTSYRTAGSLLLLAAIVCVPILIIALERAIGALPKDVIFHFGNHENPISVDRFNLLWVIIDGVTFLVSLIAMLKWREDILILPVFVFFWLAVTQVYFLIGSLTPDEGVNARAVIDVLVGLGAVWWGIRDNAHAGGKTVWAWLFGLALIFAGLALMRFYPRNDAYKLIFQINILIYALVVLLAASPLRSRIFLIFGGFGMFWFIQDISWTYFRNSLGFSLVLAISGLVTIAFGILLQRIYTKRFRIEN